MAEGISSAYLAGGARAFFGSYCGDAADRARAVERAARPLRPAVRAALEATNTRLPGGEARAANLARLAEGAVAVVTGQQVGLYLGPLFTLYKIATAIRTASALEAETGRPAVPVFWIQNEDHDLAEIAEHHVPRADGSILTVSLPVPADSRCSVAHLALPAAVEASLSALGAELGNLPHARVFLERLARWYRPGAGWSQAFAGLVAELFAGVVFVDPREPAFAAAAAPLHRRAVQEAAAIHEALAERVAALEAAGYTAQVHLRPGAPLSFVHPDGPEGPRRRIERGEDAAGLLALLEREPRCFSTSALLRPVLQDSLLPTAAYVAGPSELAYFAQLPPLYARFGLDPPLVVPRARFRVVEEKVARALARLGISAAEATRAEDELLAAASPPPAGPAELERALLEPLDAAMERVRRQLARPALDAAFAKTRATAAAAFAKLAEKYERALLHEDHERVAAVRLVRGLLRPNGAPQERVFGIPYFAARFGDHTFVERVLAGVVPFSGEERELAS